MRRLVRVVLEVEAGLHCDEAEDAVEALDLWHAHHHDVIVLDYRMPDVTGLELAEQFLAEDPDQLVVIFSGYMEPDKVKRAHEVGVCAVLTKDELRRLPEVLRDARAG